MYRTGDQLDWKERKKNTMSFLPEYRFHWSKKFVYRFIFSTENS